MGWAGQVGGVGAPWSALVDVVSLTDLATTGLQTVDGIAGVDGLVVLCVGQAPATEDGPWVMHSGQWTRPVWYASGDTVPLGFEFRVTQGISKLNRSVWVVGLGGVVDGVTPFMTEQQVGRDLRFLTGNADAVAVTNVSSLSGTTTKDDAALAANDYVLLVAQTTTTENGLWQIKSGAWIRHPLWPTGFFYPQGFVVKVTRGTLFAGSAWNMTSPNSSSAIVDTTATTWALVRPEGVRRAISLPGLAGHYLSAPSRAASRPVGDHDLRVFGDFTRTTALGGTGATVANWSTGSLCWLMYVFGGTVYFWTGTAAGAALSHPSTVTLPANVPITGIRCTIDVDNGAAGHDAKIYYTSDGVNWTQLGATITTAGTTDIKAGTGAISIGAYGDAGISLPFGGSIWGYELRSSIGGTIVSSWSADAMWNLASYTSTDSDVWTVNGTGPRWQLASGEMPGSHAHQHWTSGMDPITPAKIGALSVGTTTYTEVVATLAAAGTAIPATGTVVRLDNTSGGALTLTGTPTVSDGVTGQILIVYNGSANTVTLQDQGTLAGSNLRLSTTTIVLGTRDSITLLYSSTIGDWIEIARTNVL